MLLISAAAGFSAEAMMRRALELLASRYGESHAIVADRDYNKGYSAFDFLRRQSRPFMFDLRKNQLQPTMYRGIVLAGGVPLCPGIPETLRNPGTRPYGNKDKKQRAAKKAWHARVAAQRRYRLPIRSIRRHGLNCACPALRPSPTWQCPLRKIDRSSDLPVMLTHPSKPPEDSICVRQTVFVPDEVNKLRQQPFAWASKRWDTHYSLGRAGIEALHGDARNEDTGLLATHLTSTSFMPVIALASGAGFAILNLRKLRAWASASNADLTTATYEQRLLFASSSVLRDWLRRETSHGAWPTAD